MALSLLMATGTVSAEKSPGKYCDTPSRCINPITKYGAVTSPNYLASVAGLEVLQKGGNAVDAAIAVASTMNVVYPQMTTLGGDNFWLIYNAKTKEVKALNASGRAGELATIDFYKKKGYDKIPVKRLSGRQYRSGYSFRMGCRAQVCACQYEQRRFAVERSV